MTTALYRMYDDAGRLLYVGISKHLPARIAAHDAEKPWWSGVASITVEHIDDPIEAIRAEIDAIRSERPVHNVVHSPTARRGRVSGPGTLDERCAALRETVKEATGDTITTEQAKEIIEAVEDAAAADVVAGAIRERTGVTVTREHALAVFDEIMAELAESVNRVVTAFDLDALSAAEGLGIYQSARKWMGRHVADLASASSSPRSNE